MIMHTFLQVWPVRLGMLLCVLAGSFQRGRQSYQTSFLLGKGKVATDLRLPATVVT